MDIPTADSYWEYQRYELTEKQVKHRKFFILNTEKGGIPFSCDRKILHDCPEIDIIGTEDEES